MTIEELLRNQLSQSREAVLGIRTTQIEVLIISNQLAIMEAVLYLIKESPSNK